MNAMGKLNKCDLINGIDSLLLEVYPYVNELMSKIKK